MPTPAAEAAASDPQARPTRGRAGGTRRRRRAKPRAPSVEITAPKAWQAAAVGWTPDKLREMQLKDKDIGPAVMWVESCVRPPWTDVQGHSPMLRSLWQQYDSLTMIDGVLYRSFF